MAIKATTLRGDHVSKRETPLGRWFPVILYTVNLVLWIATGIRVEAWDLLWLTVLALPVLGLYLWTTRRHG
jgi:hypothetical protein